MFGFWKKVNNWTTFFLFVSPRVSEWFSVRLSMGLLRLLPFDSYFSTIVLLFVSLICTSGRAFQENVICGPRFCSCIVYNVSRQVPNDQLWIVKINRGGAGEWRSCQPPLHVVRIVMWTRKSRPRALGVGFTAHSDSFFPAYADTSTYVINQHRSMKLFATYSTRPQFASDSRSGLEPLTISAHLRI